MRVISAPSLKVNMKLTMNYSITRDQFSTDNGDEEYTSFSTKLVVETSQKLIIFKQK